MPWLAPAAHGVHAAEPASALNVPAAQTTHVCPSAPVAPAAHRQSVGSAAPREEFECAGQAWQAALPAAAQVPGAHAAQLVASPAANVPAAHAEHA